MALPESSKNQPCWLAGILLHGCPIIHSSMRNFIGFAVLSLVVFTACSKIEPLPGIKDTTQSVQTQTTGDAVNRVAGDKELLRQALVLADQKGTLTAALTE